MIELVVQTNDVHNSRCFVSISYSRIPAFILLHSPLLVPFYLDTPCLDTLRLDILRLDILRVAETRLMAFQSRHHRLLAIHFRPLGGSVVPLESFFVAEKTVRVRPLRLAVGAIGEKEIHELRLPDRTA